MADISLNPVTPVTNGALVSSSNPLPVAVVGGNVVRVLGASGQASATTGDTNENQLAAVTVPAGVLGTKGGLRITVWWTYTNSANNKTLRVRFSGASGTQYAAQVLTTSASNKTQLEIWNSNSASSQKMHNSTFPFTTGTGAAITSSVNTAADSTVYISGQLASGGETITLESYLVELLTAV